MKKSKKMYAVFLLISVLVMGVFTACGDCYSCGHSVTNCACNIVLAPIKIPVNCTKFLCSGCTSCLEGACDGCADSCSDGYYEEF